MKNNCWESKKCGRELGGERAFEKGVCPASIDVRFDGIHNGKNGGRTCWIISGTLCNDKGQGEFVEKFKECARCDFYYEVREKEGHNLVPTMFLLQRFENDK
ncbi:MAG: hypothetical protein HZA17_12150 [Nitrospirae bacterium]|nr:hypothetical protein [Nitrospirota bacterium]